jgi:hypothetical protein
LNKLLFDCPPAATADKGLSSFFEVLSFTLAVLAFFIQLASSTDLFKHGRLELELSREENVPTTVSVKLKTSKKEL